MFNLSENKINECNNFEHIQKTKDRNEPEDGIKVKNEKKGLKG
jgi:hypothetical protein